MELLLDLTSGLGAWIHQLVYQLVEFLKGSQQGREPMPLGGGLEKVPPAGGDIPGLSTPLPMNNSGNEEGSGQSSQAPVPVSGSGRGLVEESRRPLDLDLNAPPRQEEVDVFEQAALREEPPGAVALREEQRQEFDRKREEVQGLLKKAFRACKSIEKRLYFGGNTTWDENGFRDLTEDFANTQYPKPEGEGPSASNYATLLTKLDTDIRELKKDCSHAEVFARFAKEENPYYTPKKRK